MIKRLQAYKARHDILELAGAAILGGMLPYEEMQMPEDDFYDDPIITTNELMKD